MPKFYAVVKGRRTGIFDTWDECNKQVNGFSGCRYKSFKTRAEAQSFLQTGGASSASTNRGSDNKSTRHDAKEKRQGSRKRPLSPELAERPATMNAAPVPKKRSIKTEPGHPARRDLKIHIMFDGGARGNPGIGGAGAFVTILDLSPANDYRRTIKIRYFVGRKVTNNEAEYQGLIWGLNAARHEVTSLGQTAASLAISLIIQGDSNLIIQQLHGHYRCKNEKLKPLYAQVKRTLEDIARLGQEQFSESIEHVYREQNKVADALANEAMDAGRSWFTTSEDEEEAQHDVQSLLP